MARPASTNAIPVNPVQAFPPKGIHCGTMGATA
jgi:hypothetical protein